MTLRRAIMSSAAAAAVLLLAGSAQAAPAFRILDRIAGPDARWDYVRVDGAVGRVLVAQGESVTAFDLATRAVTPGIAPGQRLHDALPVNGGAELLVTRADRTAPSSSTRARAPSWPRSRPARVLTPPTSIRRRAWSW
jgi:hypothetical protein